MAEVGVRCGPPYATVETCDPDLLDCALAAVSELVSVAWIDPVLKSIAKVIWSV